MNGDAKWTNPLLRRQVIRNQLAPCSFILLAVYAVEIVLHVTSTSAQNECDPTHCFPMISKYVIGLVAISHGGYLVNKAIPVTQTSPKDAQ
jgi:hypothetical protein